MSDLGWPGIGGTEALPWALVLVGGVTSGGILHSEVLSSIGIGFFRLLTHPQAGLATLHRGRS